MRFGRVKMAKAVKLSNEMISLAEINARAYHRSTAKQIEHWARIGKISEENPDLNYTMIQEILISLEEMRAGNTEPYFFEGDQSISATTNQKPVK